MASNSKLNRLSHAAQQSFEDALGVLGSVDEFLHDGNYAEALDHLDVVISELMTLRAYLEPLAPSTH